MKKGLIFLMLAILISCQTNVKRGFLIVVDPLTYEQAQEEILAYEHVLTQEGLNVKIVHDYAAHPDSIRAILETHYHNDFHLEGVVFIGNVPVAMLRDAQHLSTAFKMDQERFPMWRSSIPSDRFYDDFDLSFEFIERDSVYKNHFYFKLKPSSRQSLQADIYSGRIKIPHDEDGEKLKMYLRKVVDAHQNPTAINNVMFFAGHGYNSESWIARMDEKIELLHQFPQLKGADGSLDFLDHSFEVHTKFRLLSLLNSEKMDLALLHHHGGINAQYLNGMPNVSGVGQSIDNIRYYLRSKMESGLRSGKTEKEVIQYYGNWLDVPASWFKGALDKEQQTEDSLFNANLDIYPKDLVNFKTNVKFLMVDACFNGSFQKDDYMVANHVFNQGNIVAAQANSVNVIQDKFPDNMLGLLNNGIRVGEWNRFVCSLETHLIGDPTFRFQTNRELSYEQMQAMAGNASKLKQLIENGSADEQCWAMMHLYRLTGDAASDQLLKSFKASEYGLVRMEALKLLSLIVDDNFIEALKLGLHDSYELVRRTSALLCGRSGNPDLAPDLVAAYLWAGQSKRVNYQLVDAMGMFETNVLHEALVEYLASESGFWDKDDVLKETSALINKSSATTNRYRNELKNDSASIKDKKFALRAFRNSNYHPAIDELCNLMIKNDSEELTCLTLEVLAWFDHSYKKETILKTCQMLKEGNYSELIQSEAERTINRLNHVQWN